MVSHPRVVVGLSKERAAINKSFKEESTPCHSSTKRTGCDHRGTLLTGVLPPSLLSYLSYTTEGHMPRDDTTHSGLDSLASISD